MPLRFVVLLDDMLPVLIPTDWRLNAAVQSSQGGGSRELLAEPAATNHADQLECDNWMVPPANLHPSPAFKHFLRALNQMDFFLFLDFNPNDLKSQVNYYVVKKRMPLKMNKAK